MPFLIQTGLEKFQFNRSRPISEPVWNQFPSVVSRSPYLFPSSCCASCREFMKRAILQNEKKRKKEKKNGEGKRTSTSDKNRRATCPPEGGGGQQRDERDGIRSGSGRGMDGTRGSAGSDQLGEGNYLRSFDLELDLTGGRKNREWIAARDARWRGIRRGRERKNGRSSDGEEGGRDVNGSFPWDVPVFHGVPQDLSMVVSRVVLRYAVLRVGYTYGDVGAARRERTRVCTQACYGTGVEILHRTLPFPRYQHHPQGIPSGAISGLVAESRPAP